MAINTQKVVVGGLAAGVVGTLLNFPIFMYMLGPRMNAEMDAVAPGISTKMNSGTANLVIGIGGGFVIAWLLTWLYAAMRPRLGPGPKTAAWAGFVVWLCGFVFYSGYYTSGMMTGATYMMASAAALVVNIIVANVGAYLYKEEGA